MTFGWTPVLYAMIASACVIVSVIIAEIHIPGKRLTSAVQHFAAGIVFAAVSIELLPRITHNVSRVTVALGFALGILTMLGVKWFAEKLEEKSETAQAMPLGMLAAVGIDLFIDGILMGVAFIAGEQSGILVAVALAIEIFFLGLSVASSLIQKGISRVKMLGVTVLLAVLTPLGAFLSTTLLLQNVPKSLLTETLAFGVAALLYLVAEELLVEAHEVEETPWITAMFFVGFLVILLLEI